MRRRAYILDVEASHRIRLPQPLCSQFDWIAGEKAIAAWLLVATSDRCRLFSAVEVDSEADMQLLKTRIAEELSARYTGALEFQNATSVTLTLRLVEIQITHHETSGWRLTLPGPIAAIMQLRAGDSSVAALIVQQHIEIWTIQMLKSSANVPLPDIL